MDSFVAGLEQNKSLTSVEFFDCEDNGETMDYFLHFLGNSNTSLQSVIIRMPDRFPHDASRQIATILRNNSSLR